MFDWLVSWHCEQRASKRNEQSLSRSSLLGECAQLSSDIQKASFVAPPMVVESGKSYKNELTKYDQFHLPISIYIYILYAQIVYTQNDTTFSGSKAMKPAVKRRISFPSFLGKPRHGGTSKHIVSNIGSFERLKKHVKRSGLWRTEMTGMGRLIPL